MARSIRWFFSALSGAVILAVLFYFFGPKAYHTYYRHALELSLNGNHARAVLEYLKAADEAVKEESPEAHEIAATATFDAARTSEVYLRDYRGALSHYENLVQNYPQHPKSVEAMLGLARLFVTLGDLREAIRRYSLFLQRFPRHERVPEVRREIVKLYFELEEFDQTEVEGEQFLQDFPNNPEVPRVKYLIGRSMVARGRIEEAANLFEATYQTYPESYYGKMARFEMANCLKSMDKREEALEIYRKLLATHPNPQVVHAQIEAIENALDSGKGSEVPPDPWGFPSPGLHKKPAPPPTPANPQPKAPAKPAPKKKEPEPKVFKPRPEGIHRAN